MAPSRAEAGSLSSSASLLDLHVVSGRFGECREFVRLPSALPMLIAIDTLAFCLIIAISIARVPASLLLTADF